MKNIIDKTLNLLDKAGAHMVILQSALLLAYFSPYKIQSEWITFSPFIVYLSIYFIMFVVERIDCMVDKFFS